MIKVLIVCYYYAPNNTVGAVRPTKLAKYLHENGYAVEVVTLGNTGNDAYHAEQPDFPCYRMIEQPVVPAVKKKKRQHKKKDSYCMAQLKAHYRAFQSNKAQMAFFRYVKEIFDRELQHHNYDAVLTTFGPIGSLWAGMYLKKKYPHIKWICDFRDPAVTAVTPVFVNPIYGYFQRKACKMADMIVAVSNGYLARICKGRYPEKSYMIPNGYDDTDRVERCETQDERFSFAYVGSLYEGKRDLSLLFRAIREMIDSGKMDAEKIRFHYAGGGLAFLRGQAQPYGLEGIIDDHGRMTHEACMALQASVRFLVMSTWNEKGEEGVFPGKLIEYMLMKKPVINITNGELPNCEVTQVIRELELGVSCEEADSESYTALTRWLEAQCSAFHAGQAAIFQPKTEEIEARYNWKNIIKRFGELIDG